MPPPVLLADAHPGPAEELAALCEAAGLECETCVYVKTDLINRKLGLCAPRIFVQGVFRKRGGVTV